MDEQYGGAIDVVGVVDGRVFVVDTVAASELRFWHEIITVIGEHKRFFSSQRLMITRPAPVLVQQ
jgi:hypothetical protein